MIEAVDLDVNELCGGDGDIDDVVDNQARLTDEGDNRNSDTENQNAKDKTAKTVKKVVRKPRPKLNPERLGGERGISILPKIFSEVKLRGKGHEKEDLDLILKTYEHWAHRLFPLFSFDDTLQRIEELGSKKEVQTYVNKIRLGMPLHGGGVIDNDDDDDEDSRDQPTVIDSQLHATLFNAAAATNDTSQNVDKTSQPEVQTVNTEEELRNHYLEDEMLAALEADMIDS